MEGDEGRPYYLKDTKFGKYKIFVNYYADLTHLVP